MQRHREQHHADRRLFLAWASRLLKPTCKASATKARLPAGRIFPAFQPDDDGGDGLPPTELVWRKCVASPRVRRASPAFLALTLQSMLSLLVLSAGRSLCPKN